MPTSQSSYSCLTRYSCLTLAILALTTQFGCVALSIPSERLHDPGDHGGLFGDWNHDVDHNVDQVGACTDGHCEDPSRCLVGMPCDGGPLDSDPLDPMLDLDGNPKKNEEKVPWPRFHPVPTRPVFGQPLIE
jgi:hypothetical protein